MPRRALVSEDPVFVEPDGPPPPAAAGMTLEAYATRWLRRYCRRLKSRARETYRYNLELHVLPGLGAATRLDALTREQIGDFLQARLAAGYSARTVWLMFKVLRTMLNAARLDDGLLVQNPTERVSRLLPKRNDQPTIDGVLTRAELAAFLASAPRAHPVIGALFIVAARTGMRLGELLGLQWGDLDLERRVVVVRRTLDWRQRSNSPKGGVSRDLPLSRHATAVLQDLAERPDRPRSSPFVFCNPSGRPWSRSYVQRMAHRTCTLAGIARRTTHTLRHTFLTRLAEAGTNPWAIRDLARHKSIATTEGYLHLNQRYLPLVDAVEAEP